MFSWASKCLKYHNHIKTLTAINVLRFHLQSDNTVKEPRCLLQSISLNLVATKIYHFSIKAPGPAKSMLWSQGTKLTVARRFAMEMQAVSWWGSFRAAHSRLATTRISWSVTRMKTLMRPCRLSSVLWILKQTYKPLGTWSGRLNANYSHCLKNNAWSSRFSGWIWTPG